MKIILYYKYYLYTFNDNIGLLMKILNYLYYLYIRIRFYFTFLSRYWF